MKSAFNSFKKRIHKKSESGLYALKLSKNSSMDILVLDDGFKGNFNQSYGIAASFHEPRIESIRISFRGPGYSLPHRKGEAPFLSKVLALLCCFRAFSLGRRLLRTFLSDRGDYILKKSKSCDIIISSGSVLAPVNLLLCKRGVKTKSVHTMVPAFIPLKLFDFLVVPFHDYLKLKKERLDNIMVTLGAPNRINEEFLMLEAEKARKAINIKKKEGCANLGVLLGGEDQNYSVTLEYVQRLMNELLDKEKDYSLILSTSRRTDEKTVSFLAELTASKKEKISYAEFPGISELSYYPGILAFCDIIIVTEDSINMISEAASCGLPVIILGVERKNRRKLSFDFTIEKFSEKGYAQYIPCDKLYLLHDIIKLSANRFQVKLKEAEECARKISKTMK